MFSFVLQFYKLFDELFPGKIKFVLTYRPTESWYASMDHYFGKKTATPGRRAIYGAGFGNPMVQYRVLCQWNPPLS